MPPCRLSAGFYRSSLEMPAASGDGIRVAFRHSKGIYITLLVETFKVGILHRCLLVQHTRAHTHTHTDRFEGAVRQGQSEASIISLTRGIGFCLHNGGAGGPGGGGGGAGEGGLWGGGRAVCGEGLGWQTRSSCSDGKLQAWLLSWSLKGSER